MRTKPLSIELLAAVKNHPGLKNFQAGRCGYSRDISLENVDLWLYRFTVKDPTVNIALDYPHFVTGGPTQVVEKDLHTAEAHLARWAHKQESAMKECTAKGQNKTDDSEVKECTAKRLNTN